MKAAIKIIAWIALFIAAIGTVGACEAGNIGMFRCLVQGGLCILGMYIIIKTGGSNNDKR